MPGPNHGAGVKILVHNQTEIPRIHDLGVAVPPGAYALIGMLASQVSLAHDDVIKWKHVPPYWPSPVPGDYPSQRPVTLRIAPEQTVD